MADTALVGRSAQIEEITVALDSASTGRGQVLILTGEPGIGKSALVDETNRLAHDQNFSALTTRCPEQEGAPPFWPWTLALTQIAKSNPELIDDLTERNRATLSSIVPALDTEDSPASASDSQFDLFMVTTNLIKSLANGSPLIITIDDLHWADSSSLKLLEHIADNIEGTKILLLCAMRDTEFDIGNDLSSTLASLARHTATSRIPLNRLGQKASIELLAQTIDDSISPDLLENIFSYAEGNPFYTLELARLHQQTNTIGDSDQFVVPAGVRDVVSQRLNLLEELTCPR
jgi:predicted ATPase